MKFPENNLKKILKEIRLYENGPAVDGMERMGLKYHKNFGVSLLNLKKIAGKYYPNQELAELLRKKDFRETKILSLMIDDPETLNEERFEAIINQITTQELAEQTVLNFLIKKEEFYNKAEVLIYSHKEFEIAAGFVFYSEIARTDKKKENHFFEVFFERGAELSENNSIDIRKSVARAFRQTALRNNELKEKVLNIMEIIKQKKSQNADIIYEEVVPLINY